MVPAFGSAQNPADVTAAFFNDMRVLTSALELVLAGILAGGNVLLEDLPGLGKTLTARCFAQALLGNPLWTFLTTPVTRSPTPKQVAAVIQRMEEL